MAVFYIWMGFILPQINDNTSFLGINAVEKFTFLSEDGLLLLFGAAVVILLTSWHNLTIWLQAVVYNIAMTVPLMIYTVAIFQSVRSGDMSNVAYLSISYLIGMMALGIAYTIKDFDLLVLNREVRLLENQVGTTTIRPRSSDN